MRKPKDITDDMVVELQDALPSGSGFNNPWEVEKKRNAIHASSTYEHMNEDGMYDKNIQFTLKFPYTDVMSFSSVFHGSDADKRFIKNDNFQEYLEETVAYHLSEHKEQFHSLEKELLLARKKIISPPSPAR